MGILFMWIIGCFIVGAVGNSRKIGFFGAFFLSLLLSPLIGLIFALTSKRTEDIEREKAMMQALKDSKTTTSTGYSVADELEKLKKLHEDGTISETEFIKQKGRILGYEYTPKEEMPKESSVVENMGKVGRWLGGKVNE